MKQAIILTVLLIAFAYSGLIAQDGKPLRISEVVELDEISMENLYNRAYLWASDGSIEGKYNIHETDQWNGLIILTSSFPFRLENKVTGWRRMEGDVFYRLSIYTRDGKYKYVFSHFVHQGSGESPIDFGRIYDTNLSNPHLSDEAQLVAIGELLSSTRELVKMKAQVLLAHMKLPTELEKIW